MEEVLYEFPAYTQNILDKLIESDWLIHCLNLDDENEIYNPAGYLYNSEFNGVKYTVHLDLNVYQYVLSAYKKNKKNKLHRDAIALMVFGKFAKIVFDTTLAVYEKVNYLEQCPDEILDDLHLFRKIDNSNIESLAKFALGYTDDIHLSEEPVFERDILKYELTRYSRLKKWDNCYLFILKITELYYFDKSSNEEKIAKFLNWSFSDFMYSLVAISFAIKLMGNEPLPKLMKYKPNIGVVKSKNDLINMTWDLFLLDKFFEDWRDKSENNEFLYASNDKPLKEVLEMAISIQILDNANHLGNYLSRSLIEEINGISSIMGKKKGRRVFECSDFKGYRDELISTNELIVLS